MPVSELASGQSAPGALEEGFVHERMEAGSCGVLTLAACGACISPPVQVVPFLSEAFVLLRCFQPDPHVAKPGTSFLL